MTTKEGLSFTYGNMSKETPLSTWQIKASTNIILAESSVPDLYV